MGMVFFLNNRSTAAATLRPSWPAGLCTLDEAVAGSWVAVDTDRIMSARVSKGTPFLIGRRPCGTGRPEGTRPLIGHRSWDGHWSTSTVLVLSSLLAYRSGQLGRANQASGMRTHSETGKNAPIRGRVAKETTRPLINPQGHDTVSPVITGPSGRQGERRLVATGRQPIRGGGGHHQGSGI